MSSKTFYSIFAFTLAFMMGLVANWAITRQYVSNYNRHGKCPNQMRKYQPSAHTTDFQTQRRRPPCSMQNRDLDIRPMPVDTVEVEVVEEAPNR